MIRVECTIWSQPIALPLLVHSQLLHSIALFIARARYVKLAIGHSPSLSLLSAMPKNYGPPKGYEYTPPKGPDTTKVTVTKDRIIVVRSDGEGKICPKDSGPVGPQVIECIKKNECIKKTECIKKNDCGCE